MTVPLADLVPPGARPAVLSLLKGIHTVIFASVGAMLLLVAWDGLRQRPRRRTVAAFAIVVAESAVYASNNQVCPLTPLAEQLGASRGSVADIFLPDWFSRRIPVIVGSLAIIGLGLNLRALCHHRPLGGHVHRPSATSPRGT